MGNWSSGLPKRSGKFLFWNAKSNAFAVLEYTYLENAPSDSELEQLYLEPNTLWYIEIPPMPTIEKESTQ